MHLWSDLHISTPTSSSWSWPSNNGGISEPTDRIGHTSNMEEKIIQKNSKSIMYLARPTLTLVTTASPNTYDGEGDPRPASPRPRRHLTMVDLARSSETSPCWPLPSLATIKKNKEKNKEKNCKKIQNLIKKISTSAPSMPRRITGIRISDFRPKLTK